MSGPISLSRLPPLRRVQLNRRSLRLAYATAGHNLVKASSTALLGFGLDSFVEVSSAANPGAPAPAAPRPWTGDIVTPRP